MEFEFQRITVDQLRRKLQERTVRLLDLRSPGEFARGHVLGSENYPLQELLQNPHYVSLKPAQDVLCLICTDASKADLAAGVLRDSGINNVRVVAGGMKSWTALGYPLEFKPSA